MTRGRGWNFRKKWQESGILHFRTFRTLAIKRLISIIAHIDSEKGLRFIRAFYRAFVWQMLWFYTLSYKQSVPQNGEKGSPKIRTKIREMFFIFSAMFFLGVGI